MQRLREEAVEQQADRIKLEAQLTAAAQRLGAKHRVMAEVRWHASRVFRDSHGAAAGHQKLSTASAAHGVAAI